MAIIAYRKRLIYKRRRRMIPRRRIFKARSLFPKRTIYIHKGRFRLFKHRTKMPRFFRRFNTYILDTRRGGSFSQIYTQKPSRVISSFDLDHVKNKWQTQWGRKKAAWTVGVKPPERREDVQFERQFDREKKKSFKKTFDIPKQNGFINKGWFRKGEAPPQRKYTNYGPKKRLGPHPVIVIYPTIELMKALKKEQGRYTTGWMSDLVKSILDDLRENLLKHAELVIGLYVPKDTGDLQKSMLKELKRRHRIGYRLEMRIGTPVVGKNTMTYASPVNHMSEKMLRHDGVWERRRGVIQYLNDPKAQHGWYEKIRMILNNHLVEKILPAFYRELIGSGKKKTKVGMIPRQGFSTSTNREEYIKEKQRTKRERFGKHRQKVEKARRENKIKTSSFKLVDVKKWFKIEIPFKR